MKVLLGILIWVLALLIFGIPIAILSLFKWFIILFYSGRRIRGEEGSSGDDDNDDGDILQGLPVADCMFGPASSWDKPVINSGFVLKLQRRENGEGLSIAQLRDHFSKCFLKDQIEGGRYDKFFSYLVVRGGYAFRASRKCICLEDHILEVDLEEITDQQGDRISVEKFIADWLLTGYKVELPCWEMDLISAEGYQFLAFKIHHAQADGYSILHVLDKLTNNRSPYLVKDFPEGRLAYFKQLLEGPTNLGRIGGGAPPDQNPFRVTPSSKHEWMLSFTSFPLDKMKGIRRKYGVHTQSLLLTIMSGAMREFLETERGMKEVPEYVKVGNTSPWPRHPSRNDGVANKDKMCNSWVGIMLTIPLRDPDPLSRLKQIDAELISYKESGLDKFTKQVLLPVMGMMPASILDTAVSGSDPGVAAGLTSLIGGDNYSLLGCHVEEIHPFLAVHDQCAYISLSCFTFSHSGKMEVSFGCHPSVIKDQESLNYFCHTLCHKQLDLILSKNE